ncbi:glutathione S-transferase family protein [Roseobacter denitrificans]|uniref:Glutathione S-transferase, putative n=1 Tax=Roseobacter denitrificans (strain ATCC 33942 / OCh 114) TaxID=375451 RepID=Q163P6_ROSDO|nr:glutathione S-transferase family protein [Roseobacter denitrificans]ABG32797.1 glutathione S-transferase, putative [Roseobacter denitrificans OCh 114]AVL52203.1 glutathione S-transferase family protein [Roseobacter denitrificans]SFF95044.1 glutathione S-transferase [Roseobacter denitrificans OCh 114]
MITLHHCPQTRSMRTLWLLNELEIPFQLRSYPFDRSLRSPEFLTLSPAGRVPALEVDGERMFETGAITEYLCERYSPDRLGRSTASPDRMTWLVWLHFAETLSQHVAALTQQHVMLYEDHMRSPIVMKLEAARVGKCFDAIEARLSTPIESRDYLLTSGFSAADISVGQAVYMASHFVRLGGYPALEAWYERITAREGFKAALPNGGGIYSQDFYAPWPLE